MEKSTSPKKQTFRVRINRKDTRKDQPYLSCVIITNTTILLEFQADEGNKPEISDLMEMSN